MNTKCKLKLFRKKAKNVLKIINLFHPKKKKKSNKGIEIEVEFEFALERHGRGGECRGIISR